MAVDSGSLAEHQAAMDKAHADARAKQQNHPHSHPVPLQPRKDEAHTESAGPVKGHGYPAGTS